MTSWAELLTAAEVDDHVVQLYGEDDALLIRNVVRYLMVGVRRGDGLIVIATPEHIRAITRHLVQEDPGAAAEAESDGRLVYLDAGETLARFLVDDVPDEGAFRTVVGEALARCRARSRTGAIRAFGEMVSLLWEAGSHTAAARLEALWNALLAEQGCSLYCAYRIDLFSPVSDAAELQPIVCSHDHVLAGSGTLLSGGRSAA
jgi:hypothetical protein